MTMAAALSLSGQLNFRHLLPTKLEEFEQVGDPGEEEEQAEMNSGHISPALDKQIAKKEQREHEHHGLKGKCRGLIGYGKLQLVLCLDGEITG